ncbi:MAG: hypothetical protein CMJ49_03420 [Planctomycetaceae bacterium]|nr:hypothetical protein [Planctomycetaceae bacterium]
MSQSQNQPASADADPGIVIVDHGSRREESNALLLDVVGMFRRLTDYQIIEPAHMELAEPTIATAFGRCVDQGARTVVVHPYFLLPGRHWDQDIPRLTAEAATQHPGVQFLVTAPLGLHESMAQIMDERIRHCLACAHGQVAPCELCAAQGRAQCRLRGG